MGGTVTDRRIPTVAVGMPVYNADSFLEATIRSLLSQTYSDLEIVICDNASKDRTEEIGRDFAAADPRVRYHRNRANFGLVANFNKVFELSRSPFFKWNSYDDFCEPTLLEKCVAELQKDPDVACAYSLAKQVDTHGNIIAHPVEPSLEEDLSSPEVLVRIKAAVLKDGWSGVVHGLFRRNVMAGFLPYRDYFGADRVLLTQLAMHGRSVAVEPELFVQRYHDENTSSRSTRELAQLLTGRKPSGLIFPIGRAFVDYVRLFWGEDINVVQKIRATSYLVRHGIRPDVIQNLLLPGPFNYFGLEIDLFKSRQKKRYDGSKGRTVNEPVL